MNISVIYSHPGCYPPEKKPNKMSISVITPWLLSTRKKQQNEHFCYNTLAAIHQKKKTQWNEHFCYNTLAAIHQNKKH